MTKPKNVLQLVDKHYDEMFEFLCETQDENFADLVIEVKLTNDGTTVRRSWVDRDEMIKKRDEVK